MEGSVANRNAKESLDLAYQISLLLGTGLDRYTLSLLIALCDRGVNPEALSALVRELSSGSVTSSNGSATVQASSTSGAGSLRSNFRQY